MKVLRSGGEYLEAREYWAWTALAVATLTGMFVALFVWQQGHKIIALIAAAVIAVWLAPTALRMLSRARKGRLGERLVTQLLGRLSDEYLLVNDVVLGFGNIDHVLIGPCGVVVIETKRVGGDIRCDGDNWWVRGFATRSYSKQAKAAAAAVRGFLAARHSRLEREYVQAVIAFADPHCRLQTNRADVLIVRFFELLPVIAGMAAKRRMDPTLAYIAASALAKSAQESQGRRTR